MKISRIANHSLLPKNEALKVVCGDDLPSGETGLHFVIFAAEWFNEPPREKTFFDRNLPKEMVLKNSIYILFQFFFFSTNTDPMLFERMFLKVNLDRIPKFNGYYYWLNKFTGCCTQTLVNLFNFLTYTNLEKIIFTCMNLRIIYLNTKNNNY